MFLVQSIHQSSHKDIIMPTPHRPYAIHVCRLVQEPIYSIERTDFDHHMRWEPEGIYLQPAKTLASAKKQFLKEYNYFDNENYKIEGAILKVKGWKIFMERVGEKTTNATDTSS